MSCVHETKVLPYATDIETTEIDEESNESDFSGPDKIVVQEAESEHGYLSEQLRQEDAIIDFTTSMSRTFIPWPSNGDAMITLVSALT